MARTGIYEGVHFDPEVFTAYMQEQSCINTAMLASGIFMNDPEITNALGTTNVGTIPYFLPIDDETEALNFDGTTDNAPTDLKNGVQSFVACSRMKAWKEKDFVRYLTGTSPLQNLADNLVVPYWTRERLLDLLAIIEGVMSVDEMADHKSELPLTADLDMFTATIDLKQKALGDKMGNFGLIVMDSKLYAELVKQNVINFIKYTRPDTLATTDVPVLNGCAVLATDFGTVVKEDTKLTHKCYLLGNGSFLTGEKPLENPYVENYDPEKNGGIKKLYTKQSYVMHPNGLSFVADNMAKEAPTRAELKAKANWKLKFNHKNVAIAELDIIETLAQDDSGKE